MAASAVQRLVVWHDQRDSARRALTLLDSRLVGMSPDAVISLLGACEPALVALDEAAAALQDVLDSSDDRRRQGGAPQKDAPPCDWSI